MKALVTGGAGFIGSNFVHWALEEDRYDKITTVDALTYAGTTENLEGTLEDDRHEFVEADIRDDDTMDELVADADVVFNFAAESHVDRSIEDASEFVSTNVDGTRVLLDAAVEHDIDRFVQISTDEVYGEILEGEFTESDPLEPRNPYSATKASADLLVRSYYETHDLPIIITRSSNNFGPHQHAEKLIPKFITRSLAGKELPVYGDGSNVREWTYVVDNCRGIDLAAHEGEPGEVYNVGASAERTNLEVTEAILEATDGSEDQITFVEDRPGHDQRYALDTSKLEALGWEPTWSFEEGLEKTVNDLR
ncbi:dTDP-glucose 4,6-dehydratase [Natronorubrum bangense]|uniref:dTDP-glucose 4,6-dehydratase n=1 Tax=Natronorubrum bangense JCM 10635 TaxID=1227500 RepID=L9W020_9EURY|nr:dTDP-glucose 4,6-dehydratase [Natronorubrum bangense]ELY42641.1 dTDP-glucose 4,6-dehydratase [Natronorubrum bangense JCM 10635]